MANEAPTREPDSDSFRIAKRDANELKARAVAPATDAQGLVEFACECMRADCERTVKAPLHVYRRMAAGGEQYLLQAGHHAFLRHRTIVTSGSMRIEEEVS